MWTCQVLTKTCMLPCVTRENILCISGMRLGSFGLNLNFWKVLIIKIDCLAAIAWKLKAKEKSLGYGARHQQATVTPNPKHFRKTTFKIVFFLLVKGSVCCLCMIEWSSLQWASTENLSMAFSLCRQHWTDKKDGRQCSCSVDPSCHLYQEVVRQRKLDLLLDYQCHYLFQSWLTLLAQSVISSGANSTMWRNMIWWNTIWCNSNPLNLTYCDV